MQAIGRFLRNECPAPNPGPGETPTDRPLTLVLPAGEDWDLFYAMEREGLRLGVFFALEALADDDLAALVAARAAGAVLGEHFASWEDATFGDGSYIEDPLMVELAVLDLLPRLGGLAGPTMDYRVIARFDRALAHD